MEGRGEGDWAIVQVATTFILVCPTKRRDIIVQLRKGRPMECLTTVRHSEVCRDLVWLNWREPFDTCLLERVRGDRFVELSVTGVRAINWFERNEFKRIRGQV